MNARLQITPSAKANKGLVLDKFISVKIKTKKEDGFIDSLNDVDAI